MASHKYTGEEVYDEVYCGNWKEVENMVTAQPEILNDRYNGITSLRHIIYWCPYEEFILKTLQYSSMKDIEELDQEGQFSTILHPLSVRGFSKALDYVLSKSSKRVNSQDEDGNTPLHWLLRSNLPFASHLESARVLLKYKADVHLNNKEELSPLEKYLGNTCKKYDVVDKDKQKEEVVKLLNSEIPTI